MIDKLIPEKIEQNIYRGAAFGEEKGTVFGGFALAQALYACGLTVPEDRFLHSLHSYFILPGDATAPIVFDIDRIRDGRSFTTRRVVAIQHGRPIFNLSASFQIREEGLSHQVSKPEVPAPENFPPTYELATQDNDPARFWINYITQQIRPLDFRVVQPINRDLFPIKKHVWFRADQKLSDDFLLHQTILACASDYTFLSSSLEPHLKQNPKLNFRLATIDHSVWLHRPFRVDEWLLFSHESHNAYGARGFNQGHIYAQDGSLVASLTQENLMRVIE